MMQSSQVRRVDLELMPNSLCQSSDTPKELPLWMRDETKFLLDWFNVNQTNIVPCTKEYTSDLTKWRICKNLSTATILRKFLKRIMGFIQTHMSYVDVKNLIDCELEEELTIIVGMYMDMELKVWLKKRDEIPDVLDEHEHRITERILHWFYTLLTTHTQRIDTLLSLQTVYSRHSQPIFDPIFRKVLSEMPNGPLSDVSYVRYMLTYKLWRERVLVTDDNATNELRRRIIANLVPIHSFNSFNASLKSCLRQTPRSESNVAKYHMMPNNTNLRKSCKDFLAKCRVPLDEINFGSISLVDDELEHMLDNETNGIDQLIKMIANRKASVPTTSPSPVDFVDLTDIDPEPSTNNPSHANPEPVAPTVVIDLTKEVDSTSPGKRPPSLDYSISRASQESRRTYHDEEDVYMSSNSVNFIFMCPLNHQDEFKRSQLDQKFRSICNDPNHGHANCSSFQFANNEETTRNQSSAPTSDAAAQCNSVNNDSNEPSDNLFSGNCDKSGDRTSPVTQNVSNSSCAHVQPVAAVRSPKQLTNVELTSDRLQEPPEKPKQKVYPFMKESNPRGTYLRRFSEKLDKRKLAELQKQTNLPQSEPQFNSEASIRLDFSDTQTKHTKLVELQLQKELSSLHQSDPMPRSPPQNDADLNSSTTTLKQKIDELRKPTLPKTDPIIGRISPSTTSRSQTKFDHSLDRTPCSRASRSLNEFISDTPSKQREISCSKTNRSLVEFESDVQQSLKSNVLESSSKTIRKVTLPVPKSPATENPTRQRLRISPEPRNDDTLRCKPLKELQATSQALLTREKALCFSLTSPVPEVNSTIKPDNILNNEGTESVHQIEENQTIIEDIERIIAKHQTDVDQFNKSASTDENLSEIEYPVPEQISDQNISNSINIPEVNIHEILISNIESLSEEIEQDISFPEVDSELILDPENIPASDLENNQNISIPEADETISATVETMISEIETILENNEQNSVPESRPDILTEQPIISTIETPDPECSTVATIISEIKTVSDNIKDNITFLENIHENITPRVITDSQLNSETEIINSNIFTDLTETIGDTSMVEQSESSFSDTELVINETSTDLNTVAETLTTANTENSLSISDTTATGTAPKIVSETSAITDNVAEEIVSNLIKDNTRTDMSESKNVESSSNDQQINEILTIVEQITNNAVTEIINSTEYMMHTPEIQAIEELLNCTEDTVSSQLTEADNPIVLLDKNSEVKIHEPNLQEVIAEATVESQLRDNQMVLLDKNSELLIQEPNLQEVTAEDTVESQLTEAENQMVLPDKNSEVLIHDPSIQEVSAEVTIETEDEIIPEKIVRFDNVVVIVSEVKEEIISKPEKTKYPVTKRQVLAKRRTKLAKNIKPQPNLKNAEQQNRLETETNPPEIINSEIHCPELVKPVEPSKIDANTPKKRGRRRKVPLPTETPAEPTDSTVPRRGRRKKCTTTTLEDFPKLENSPSGTSRRKKAPPVHISQIKTQSDIISNITQEQNAVATSDTCLPASTGSSGVIVPVVEIAKRRKRKQIFEVLSDVPQKIRKLAITDKTVQLPQEPKIENERTLVILCEKLCDTDLMGRTNSNQLLRLNRPPITEKQSSKKLEESIKQSSNQDTVLVSNRLKPIVSEKLKSKKLRGTIDEDDTDAYLELKLREIANSNRLSQQCRSSILERQTSKNLDVPTTKPDTNLENLETTNSNRLLRRTSIADKQKSIKLKEPTNQDQHQTLMRPAPEIPKSKKLEETVKEPVASNTNVEEKLTLETMSKPIEIKRKRGRPPKIKDKLISKPSDTDVKTITGTSNDTSIANRLNEETLRLDSTNKSSNTVKRNSIDLIIESVVKNHCLEVSEDDVPLTMRKATKPKVEKLNKNLESEDNVPLGNRRETSKIKVLQPAEIIKKFCSTLNTVTDNHNFPTDKTERGISEDVRNTTQVQNTSRTENTEKENISENITKKSGEMSEHLESVDKDRFKSDAEDIQLVGITTNENSEPLETKFNIVESEIKGSCWSSADTCGNIDPNETVLNSQLDKNNPATSNHCTNDPASPKRKKSKSVSFDLTPNIFLIKKFKSIHKKTPIKVQIGNKQINLNLDKTKMKQIKQSQKTNNTKVRDSATVDSKIKNKSKILQSKHHNLEEVTPICEPNILDDSQSIEEVSSENIIVEQPNIADDSFVIQESIEIPIEDFSINSDETSPGNVKETEETMLITSNEFEANIEELRTPDEIETMSIDNFQIIPDEAVAVIESANDINSQETLLTAEELAENVLSNSEDTTGEFETIVNSQISLEDAGTVTVNEINLREPEPILATELTNVFSSEEILIETPEETATDAVKINSLESEPVLEQTHVLPNTDIQQHIVTNNSQILNIKNVKEIMLPTEELRTDIQENIVTTDDSQELVTNLTTDAEDIVATDSHMLLNIHNEIEINSQEPDTNHLESTNALPDTEIRTDAQVLVVTDASQIRLHIVNEVEINPNADELTTDVQEEIMATDASQIISEEATIIENDLEIKSQQSNVIINSDSQEEIVEDNLQPELINTGVIKSKAIDNRSNSIIFEENQHEFQAKITEANCAQTENISTSKTTVAIEEPMHITNVVLEEMNFKPIELNAQFEDISETAAEKRITSEDEINLNKISHNELHNQSEENISDTAVEFEESIQMPEIILEEIDNEEIVNTELVVQSEEIIVSNTTAEIEEPFNISDVVSEEIITEEIIDTELVLQPDETILSDSATTNEPILASGEIDTELVVQTEEIISENTADSEEMEMTEFISGEINTELVQSEQIYSQSVAEIKESDIVYENIDCAEITPTELVEQTEEIINTELVAEIEEPGKIIYVTSEENMYDELFVQSEDIPGIEDTMKMTEVVSEEIANTELFEQTEEVITETEAEIVETIKTDTYGITKSVLSEQTEPETKEEDKGEQENQYVLESVDSVLEVQPELVETNNFNKDAELQYYSDVDISICEDIVVESSIIEENNSLDSSLTVETTDGSTIVEGEQTISAENECVTEIIEQLVNINDEPIHTPEIEQPFCNANEIVIDTPILVVSSTDVQQKSNHLHLSNDLNPKNEIEEQNNGKKTKDHDYTHIISTEQDIKSDENKELLQNNQVEFSIDSKIEQTSNVVPEVKTTIGASNTIFESIKSMNNTIGKAKFTARISKIKKLQVAYETNASRIVKAKKSRIRKLPVVLKKPDPQVEVSAISITKENKLKIDTDSQDRTEKFKVEKLKTISEIFIRQLKIAQLQKQQAKLVDQLTDEASSSKIGEVEACSESKLEMCTDNEVVVQEKVVESTEKALKESVHTDINANAPITNKAGEPESINYLIDDLFDIIHKTGGTIKSNVDTSILASSKDIQINQENEPINSETKKLEHEPNIVKVKTNGSKQIPADNFDFDLILKTFEINKNINDKKTNNIKNKKLIFTKNYYNSSESEQDELSNPEPVIDTSSDSEEINTDTKVQNTKLYKRYIAKGSAEKEAEIKNYSYLKTSKAKVEETKMDLDAKKIEQHNAQINEEIVYEEMFIPLQTKKVKENIAKQVVLPADAMYFSAPEVLENCILSNADPSKHAEKKIVKCSINGINKVNKNVIIRNDGATFYLPTQPECTTNDLIVFRTPHCKAVTSTIPSECQLSSSVSSANVSTCPSPKLVSSYSADNIPADDNYNLNILACMAFNLEPLETKTEEDIRQVHHLRTNKVCRQHRMKPGDLCMLVAFPESVPKSNKPLEEFIITDNKHNTEQYNVQKLGSVIKPKGVELENKIQALTDRAKESKKNMNNKKSGSGDDGRNMDMLTSLESILDGENSNNTTQHSLGLTESPIPMIIPNTADLHLLPDDDDFLITKPNTNQPFSLHINSEPPKINTLENGVSKDFFNDILSENETKIESKPKKSTTVTTKTKSKVKSPNKSEASFLLSKYKSSTDNKFEASPDATKTKPTSVSPPSYIRSTRPSRMVTNIKRKSSTDTGSPAKKKTNTHNVFDKLLEKRTKEILTPSPLPISTENSLPIQNAMPILDDKELEPIISVSVEDPNPLVPTTVEDFVNSQTKEIIEVNTVEVVEKEPEILPIVTETVEKLVELPVTSKEEPEKVPRVELIPKEATQMSEPDEIVEEIKILEPILVPESIEAVSEIELSEEVAKITTVIVEEPINLVKIIIPKTEVSECSSVFVEIDTEIHTEDLAKPHTTEYTPFEAMLQQDFKTDSATIVEEVPQNRNASAVVEEWFNRANNQGSPKPYVEIYNSQTIEECNFFEDISNSSELSQPTTDDANKRDEKPYSTEYQTPDSGIALDEDSVQRGKHSSEPDNLTDAETQEPINYFKNLMHPMSQAIQITDVSVVQPKNGPSIKCSIPFDRIRSIIPLLITQMPELGVDNNKKRKNIDILENVQRKIIKLSTEEDIQPVEIEMVEEVVKTKDRKDSEMEMNPEITEKEWSTDEVMSPSTSTDVSTPLRTKGSMKEYPECLFRITESPVPSGSCCINSPYPSDISLQEEPTFYVEGGIDLCTDFQDQYYESFDRLKEQQTINADFKSTDDNRKDEQQSLQAGYCVVDSQFTLPEYMNDGDLMSMIIENNMIIDKRMVAVNMHQVQPEMKPHIEDVKRTCEFADIEIDNQISGIVDGICRNLDNETIEYQIDSDLVEVDNDVHILNIDQTTSKVQVLIGSDAYQESDNSLGTMFEEVPMKTETVYTSALAKTITTQPITANQYLALPPPKASSKVIVERIEFSPTYTIVNTDAIGKEVEIKEFENKEDESVTPKPVTSFSYIRAKNKDRRSNEKQENDLFSFDTPNSKTKRQRIAKPSNEIPTTKLVNQKDAKIISNSKMPNQKSSEQKIEHKSSPNSSNEATSTKLGYQKQIETKTNSDFKMEGQKPTGQKIDLKSSPKPSNDSQSSKMVQQKQMEAKVKEFKTKTELKTQNQKSFGQKIELRSSSKLVMDAPIPKPIESKTNLNSKIQILKPYGPKVALQSNLKSSSDSPSPKSVNVKPNDSKTNPDSKIQIQTSYGQIANKVATSQRRNMDYEFDQLLASGNQQSENPKPSKAYHSSELFEPKSRYTRDQISGRRPSNASTAQFRRSSNEKSPIYIERYQQERQSQRYTSPADGNSRRYTSPRTTRMQHRTPRSEQIYLQKTDHAGRNRGSLQPSKLSLVEEKKWLEDQKLSELVQQAHLFYSKKY